MTERGRQNRARRVVRIRAQNRTEETREKIANEMESKNQGKMQKVNQLQGKKKLIRRILESDYVYACRREEGKKELRRMNRFDLLS